MSQRASHAPIELPLNQPKPSRKTRENSQKVLYMLPLIHTHTQSGRAAMQGAGLPIGSNVWLAGE